MQEAKSVIPIAIPICSKSNPRQQIDPMIDPVVLNSCSCPSFPCPLFLSFSFFLLFFFLSSSPFFSLLFLSSCFPLLFSTLCSSIFRSKTMCSDRALQKRYFFRGELGKDNKLWQQLSNVFWISWVGWSPLLSMSQRTAMGGSRSQSPAVSVCAKHCERCKDLKHVVRFCSLSLYILWILHLFLIPMPVPFTWPPCVQGPMLEAADAKNRDQASYGSYGTVISDDFRCGLYDPAWSTLKHLMLIERFQAFDSQAFFHRHPFARESLQLSPSTSLNSLDLTWKLMRVGLALVIFQFWIRRMSLRVRWHHRRRSSPLSRRQNWTVAHSMLSLGIELLPILVASSSIL